MIFLPGIYSQFATLKVQWLTSSKCRRKNSLKTAEILLPNLYLGNTSASARYHKLSPKKLSHEYCSQLEGKEKEIMGFPFFVHAKRDDYSTKRALRRRGQNRSVGAGSPPPCPPPPAPHPSTPSVQRPPPPSSTPTNALPHFPSDERPPSFSVRRTPTQNGQGLAASPSFSLLLRLVSLTLSLTLSLPHTHTCRLAITPTTAQLEAAVQVALDHHFAAVLLSAFSVRSGMGFSKILGNGTYSKRSPVEWSSNL
jgi:hypothetical protein